MTPAKENSKFLVFFFVAACFWLLYAKWFNITLISVCHVKNDPVNLTQKWNIEKWNIFSNGEELTKTD